MCEISVIIPVYNVEEYLNECMDSILNQSINDIEVICVNDGSTDSSLDILKQYSDKEDRIKIINQENRGLGAARNAGLKNSKGKYIYFIDSDDYIEQDTLEKLYCSAISNSSDIVLFKFQNVDDAHNVQRRGVEFKIDRIFGDIDYSNFSFTYMDVKKHVLNTAFSACLKLYKKEFIDSIDFTFPEGLSFEDVPVHARVMLEAERISFVNENLYNYRYNPKSITTSSAKNFDIFKVIDMVEDYLLEKGYFDEFENEFVLFKVSQTLTYLNREKSETFFKKTKEEFEKITINDDNLLSKSKINSFNLILNSNNYFEYIDKLNQKTNTTNNGKVRILVENLKNLLKS